jgi:hypothetical protein
MCWSQDLKGGRRGSNFLASSKVKTGLTGFELVSSRQSRVKSSIILRSNSQTPSALASSNRADLSLYDPATSQFIIMAGMIQFSEETKVCFSPRLGWSRTDQRLGAHWQDSRHHSRGGSLWLPPIDPLPGSAMLPVLPPTMADCDRVHKERTKTGFDQVLPFPQSQRCGH